MRRRINSVAMSWIGALSGLILLTLALIAITRSQVILAASSVSVSITENGFDPSVVTSTVGLTVVWTNQTQETMHLVSGELWHIYLPLVLRNTSDAGGTATFSSTTDTAAVQVQDSWGNVDIVPGGTYTHTFVVVGHYPYYLAGQPNRTGLIVVQGTTASAFTPLDVDVLVLGKFGQPLEGVTVHAINHEYLFRQQQVTDPNGLVTVKAVPGTWSFYATLGWGKAMSQRGTGYAPCVLGHAISQSEVVVLQPDTSVAISINNQLSGFTGLEPTAVYLVEPGLGPMVGLDIIGIESGNLLAVDTNHGISARIGLAVAPLGDSPGLFYLGEPSALDGGVNITVTPDHLGKVRVAAYDSTGQPAAYHIQIQHFQRSWPWAPWIADLPAGPHEYYFSPGDYLFLRGVDIWSDQERYRVMLNPLALTVAAGDDRVIQMSSPSQYRVLMTPKPELDYGDYTQILLDMRDDFDNQLTEAWGPSGRLAPHASISTTSAQAAGIDLGFGFAGKIEGTFDEAEEPQYKVMWDFGPHGSGSLSGHEYDPGTLAMYAYTTDRLIPQSPAVHRDRHDAWVAYYERIAEEMEELVGVPTDCPLGLVENIMHAGFADEILHGFKIEVPLEFTADPAWRAGNVYHAHEEGHGRIHKPPCNFFAVRTYAEAYATMMGYEASARVTDEARYADYLYGAHDFFLRHLHGEPIDDTGDEIEIVQFITYYLRRQHGFGIHRRMILEWNNALQPARTLLTQQGYSDIEQFAAIYSYLAGGDNLAWLFRLGGFDVEDSRTTAALQAISKDATSSGEIELVVGESLAACSRVSVPIMIRRAPAGGFNDLLVTLSYDPAQMTAVAVLKRDLTYSDSWKLDSDLNTPGQVTFSLAGTSVVAGLGTVAQVNFELAPGVSGHVPVTVASATSAQGPVSWTNGVVTMTSSPLITTLPPLPKGDIGVWYATTLTAQAGNPPYTWEIVEFDLPPGLTLDGATGVISGTPTATGEFFFRVKVRDKNELVHRRQLTISIE